jgi:hypothetical protein
MKYLALIILLSTYAYRSIGQSCNSNATEKYEKIMCEIEDLIAETYNKVQDDFGPNPIREKLRKLNNENCDKLFGKQDDLKKELYKQKELDYNLINHIDVYINSITVYINSLKIITAGNQFDVYQIAENSRAYQLMEISKLNLINLLWEKKRVFNAGSTVINWLQDSLVKFHIACSFGLYNSSLKSELEKNFDIDSLNDLSFKKLNYNFSAEYDISKKIRAGFGISSIPETGISTSVTNGRLEERIRGTTLNIQGTYIIIPNRNRSGFGIEAGFSLGVAGSFISSQRIINTSTANVIITHYAVYPFVTDSTNTNTVISYNQETYTDHTTSLGLTAGATVDIYFSKHISLRVAASEMFNTDILVPRQYYNMDDILEEQNLSYSSFTYNLGIAFHL